MFKKPCVTYLSTDDYTKIKGAAESEKRSLAGYIRVHCLKAAQELLKEAGKEVLS